MHKFNIILQSVKEICKNFCMSIIKQRLTLSQTNHFNIVTDTVVDYYRIIVYIL